MSAKEDKSNGHPRDGGDHPPSREGGSLSTGVQSSASTNVPHTTTNAQHPATQSSTVTESFHHGTTGNAFFTEDPFLPPSSTPAPADETSLDSAETFNTTSSGTTTSTDRTHLTQPRLPSHPTSSRSGGPDVNTRSAFIKWTTHLPRETLVLVRGTLARPANAQAKIHEASPRLQSVELRIEQLFVVGRVWEAPPFKFSDVRPVGEEHQEEGEGEGKGVKVSVRNELNNRVFDLRVSDRDV